MLTPTTTNGVTANTASQVARARLPRFQNAIARKRVVAGHERQHPDERARERGHGDAHEHQGDHLGAPARSRQAVDEERRQQRRP